MTLPLREQLREPVPEPLRLALRELIRRLRAGEEIVVCVDDEPTCGEPEEEVGDDE